MDTFELQSEFQALHRSLLARLEPGDSEQVLAAMAEPPKSSRTYGFEDLGQGVVARLLAIAALPKPRTAIASRALIAGLCAQNVSRFGQDLPPRVRERSIDWLAKLLPWLSNEAAADYAYPDDHFLKDYRFATGMTVPCGAQVVDLSERPGIKTVAALARSSPLLAWRAAARPWFRPHTDDRYLDEFNEDGWNRCYDEVAALLAARPNVAGMIATSWFYDPALEAISPRLDYLRRVPMAGGAVAVGHGSTQFDIDAATATSPTRRAMYEGGTYLPTCWSIVWPRDAMIAWSAARGVVRSAA